MGTFTKIRHAAAVMVCAVAMSTGLAAAAQASTAGPPATGRPAPLALTADAATPSYPANQTGSVYSCTTGRFGKVVSTNGGYTWYFIGSGGAGIPQHQTGDVYSSTTGRSAGVTTTDGGLIWTYHPPAPC